MMERRPHCDHQLQFARHRRQRRGRRPRIQRVGLHTLDVVQVQLRDQRQVIAQRLGLHGQLAHILPRGGHLLIVDVTQPPAEDWKPKAISHVIA